MVQTITIDKKNGEKEIHFRKEIDIPSTTYASFGFYNYPAKFIPQVPIYVLKKYAISGMKLFDPFAGYGTVGIASRMFGYDYELWDLNPLLEKLHSLNTLESHCINVDKVIYEMKNSNEEFIPDWNGIDYWYDENILNFLFKIWGFYHSQNSYNQTLLFSSLLKISRYYSFDDMGRQKLSTSDKSKNRILDLLKINWKEKFFKMLSDELKKVIKGLNEYSNLLPKPVKCSVDAGVDSFDKNLEGEKDILITSPPYMQSQEYMRQAKLDLYWMGYKEDYVKKLAKYEIPYRKDLVPIEINSNLYHSFRDGIKSDDLRVIYDNYFFSVLGALGRLQEKISSYLCIFIGRPSMESRPVPLDKIFVEFFNHLGLNHEETLVDTIVAKRLFDYKYNPASGNKDNRTKYEYLVVLKK